MSSAATNLQRLGKMEQRVLQPLEGDNLQHFVQDTTPLNPLQHRRNRAVAALVEFHKDAATLHAIYWDGRA